MELITWISDSLTKFGGSDPTIVDFVLATASSVKSSSQLYDKLSSYLEGGDDDVKRFAEDLFRRTGPKLSKSENVVEPKAEKKRYALLAMDHHLDDSLDQQKPKNGSQIKDKSREGRREEKNSRRERRIRERKEDDRWGDQSEEEIEQEFEDPKPNKRRRVDEHTPSLSEHEESERERDRKELRELEHRLKQKTDTTSRMEEYDMDDVREKSRQKYLREREVLKVGLLLKQVEEEADEERTNPALTARELEEFAKNRQLLKLAQDRLLARDEAEDQTGFSLQDEGRIDKSETLHRRVKEREGISDVQLWEEEQTKRAQATIGIRTARVFADDYEYVFDETQAPTFLSGGQIPGTVDKELIRFKAELAAAERREATLQEKRKELPLYAMRSELVQALRDYQCLIVSSETGSGKTTQIPQYVLEENINRDLKIAVTQPRRVAAMSVAARVAEERGARLGGEVGYSVRFESKVSDKTRIEFMTDGYLLRRLIADPLLSEYSIIMLDEAHERTIDTDILLGLLRDIMRARDDLKIIVSSATMNSGRFSSFLDDCPIFNIPGRSFPIEKLFSQQPEANYMQACISTVFQIHLSQGPGDILVFLTGQEDIEICAEQVEETMKKLGNRAKPMIVAPIYSTLPSELQAKIFEPTPEGSRKVVLATNIAETSLTIDGIVFVIDPGFSKEQSFNPATGQSSLTVTPISRAAAEQRAGRAGRVGPGTCLRLYTKYSYYNELEEEPQPEILRSDLTGVVLQLKTMGIDNILEFAFLDSPSPEALIASLELLYSLGAITSTGTVSRVGRKMVEIPAHPRLAGALLASQRYGCVQEVLTVIAMMDEAASLFFRPKEQKTHADAARARFTSKDGGGDHLTLLNVFNSWRDSNYDGFWAKENFIQQRSLMRARLVREQLEALCDRVEIPTDLSVGANEHIPILKSLLSGFFTNTATLTRDGQHYRTLRSNMQVRIHPSSVLAAQDQTYKPKVIMFNELVITSADFARGVAPIEASWLSEVAPHFWKAAEVEKLDNSKKKMPRGQGAPART